MIERYTAFDFETASGKNPCSIGVVLFENGKIIDSFYSLINPEIENFNPYTTRIHGITEEDVVFEPSFEIVWNSIWHFFEGCNIVAHNASFDLSVLNHSLERYYITKPNYESYCSLKLSRQFLDLENNKLSTVAGYYNVTQIKHHNALDDAIVCGNIFYNLINQIGDMEYIKLANKNALGISSKRISKDLILKSKNHKKFIGRCNSLANLIKSSSDKLEGNFFFVSGIFALVSRVELKKLIEDNGGKVSSSISSKTSYVVAGDKMGPSKLAKAQSIGVSIISETDFLEMIGSSLHK